MICDLHIDDKQLVVEIQQGSPGDMGLIKTAIETNLGAINTGQAVGPYFLLIDYTIDGRQFALIKDDAEGYPIYITTNDKSSIGIVNTIVDVIRRI